MIHHLLAAYIQAKEEALQYCSCPNCFDGVKKKSQNHIFCSVNCKDRFWLKIKGRKRLNYRSHEIAPVYPGGFDQWKIDLELEMGNLFEQELFDE